MDVGVNVDAKIGRFMYSKGTVLHLAAASSRLYQMAELLLDRGASVNHRDVVRRRSPGTALHFAVSSGLPDTVRLLLQRGAQIDDYAMNSAHLLRNAQVIEALRNEGEWQRVRKFVKFLHMSGFASQQWSVRQPRPMEPASSIEARAGPVVRRQQGNVCMYVLQESRNSKLIKEVLMNAQAQAILIKCRTSQPS